VRGRHSREYGVDFGTLLSERADGSVERRLPAKGVMLASWQPRSPARGGRKSCQVPASKLLREIILNGSSVPDFTEGCGSFTFFKGETGNDLRGHVWGGGVAALGINISLRPSRPMRLGYFAY